MKRFVPVFLAIILSVLDLSAQDAGGIVHTEKLSVPESAVQAKAVYLRAEDVDTFCDVSINGQYVGTTSNRFRRWEWDVKPLLHAGSNTLVGLGAKMYVLRVRRDFRIDSC